MSGDTESLAVYRSLAPAAEHAQPYPDHFMPLLVAHGASGRGSTGRLSTRAGTGGTSAWGPGVPVAGNKKPNRGRS